MSNLKQMRDERGIDILPPLAKTIINGWKKGSPVDMLVISPEPKLLGRLHANEFISSNGVGYRAFLDESVQGKRPGLVAQSNQDRTRSQKIERSTNGKTTSNEASTVTVTLDGKPLTLRDGQLFDEDGEVIGFFDEDGVVTLVGGEKEDENSNQ